MPVLAQCTFSSEVARWPRCASTLARCDLAVRPRWRGVTSLNHYAFWYETHPGASLLKDHGMFSGEVLHTSRYAVPDEVRVLARSFPPHCVLWLPRLEMDEVHGWWGPRFKYQGYPAGAGPPPSCSTASGQGNLCCSEVQTAPRCF